MITLYKMKDYLKEKLKVTRSPFKERKVQKEKQKLQQEHAQYMREKRVACNRLIESITDSFILYERDEGSTVFIDDRAKKRCIDELIKYRDSDSITHMIQQSEVLDVVISKYFGFYEKRVGFVTQYFDSDTGESYHEERYSSDAILCNFLEAIQYFDEDESHKKNTF